MPANTNKTGILIGRILSVLIVVGALGLGLVVVLETNYYDEVTTSLASEIAAEVPRPISS